MDEYKPKFELYPGLCLFNKEVGCIDHSHCSKCGWNPKVEAERKGKIYVSIWKDDKTCGTGSTS